MKNNRDLRCSACGSTDIVDHTEFGLPMGHTHRCGDCGMTWCEGDKPEGG